MHPGRAAKTAMMLQIFVLLRRDRRANGAPARGDGPFEVPASGLVIHAVIGGEEYCSVGRRLRKLAKQCIEL